MKEVFLSKARTCCYSLECFKSKTNDGNCCISLRYLPGFKTRAVEWAVIDLITPGDIGSVKWVVNGVPTHTLHPEYEVHYAVVSKTDTMRANSRLPLTTYSKDIVGKAML